MLQGLKVKAKYISPNNSSQRQSLQKANLLT